MSGLGWSVSGTLTDTTAGSKTVNLTLTAPSSLKLTKDDTYKVTYTVDRAGYSNSTPATKTATGTVGADGKITFPADFYLDTQGTTYVVVTDVTVDNVTVTYAGTNENKVSATVTASDNTLGANATYTVKVTAKAGSFEKPYYTFDYSVNGAPAVTTARIAVGEDGSVTFTIPSTLVTGDMSVRIISWTGYETM